LEIVEYSFLLFDLLDVDREGLFNLAEKRDHLGSVFFFGVFQKLSI
jgi:hypothetical protein